MAKKSMVLKQQAKPKFSVRAYNRCKICGRPHAYLRDYGVCRICFRELAYRARSRAFARHPGKDASKGTPVWGAFFRFLLRGTLSPLDTPPVPGKPGAITPSRPHGGRGRAAAARTEVRKSGTRPDFLGEFHAARCGSPVPACFNGGKRQPGNAKRAFLKFFGFFSEKDLRDTPGIVYTNNSAHQAY